VLEHLRIAGALAQHGRRVVLTQLLRIAENVERVALLEVPHERRAVAGLAAQELVRAVADALVEVGEDDDPRLRSRHRPLVGLAAGACRAMQARAERVGNRLWSLSEA